MTTGVRRRRLTVPVWHRRSEGKGGTPRTSGYRVDVASTRPLGAFHTLHEMGGGAPRAVRGGPPSESGHPHRRPPHSACSSISHQNLHPLDSDTSAERLEAQIATDVLIMRNVERNVKRR